MDPTLVKLIEVKDGGDLATQVSKRHEEISAVGKRVKEHQDLEAAKRSNDDMRSSMAAYDATDPSLFAPKSDSSDDDGDDGGKPSKVVSVGQAFVKSKAYEMAKAGLASGLIELPGTSAKSIVEGSKALFRENDGFAPEHTRIDLVVPAARRPIELIDMMRVFPTSQISVDYMLQTVFTDAAAERDEAGAYAEAEMSTRSSKSRFATSASNSCDRQSLMDVPGIRAMLDDELMFMARRRLDTQIVNGNGTGQNITGTFNVAGIGVQPKGADNIPDALYKARTVAEVTGRSVPNLFIIHPTTWQNVRLLKTNDGHYIWGPPSSAGPDDLWGMPVVRTTAVPEAKALVGDYAMFARIHVLRNALRGNWSQRRRLQQWSDDHSRRRPRSGCSHPPGGVCRGHRPSVIPRRREGLWP